MIDEPIYGRMTLRNWHYETVDLARQVDYASDPGLSVLANAVQWLNLRLIAQTEHDATLLEIGCGANSLFQKRMHAPATWEGIDVMEVDSHGRPSIATRRASVECIPWPSGTFDYVVSNQSIEHWHEFGVSLDDGLAEIRRVMKDDGKAVINFPVHLHGNRAFVTGDFLAVDAAFNRVGLRIVGRTAVIDSSVEAYRGWRKCGFPDFLIRRLPRHEGTSYVVEYVVSKDMSVDQKHEPNSVGARFQRAGAIHRALHYGFRYFLWKVSRRLVRHAR